MCIVNKKNSSPWQYFRDFVPSPLMAWPMLHPLCPGQSALALSGGIAALREPSKVSNLEATIIACLWPNAWTGSIRRGTPRPTGVIYGGQVLLWPHTNFQPQLLGR